MPQNKKQTRVTRARAAKVSSNPEVDSVFFFKLLLYVILGSMWLKITDHGTLHIPVPIGLIIGLCFTAHEHFQIDKKIEYAVLIIAMLVGFLAPFGLYISF